MPDSTPPQIATLRILILSPTNPSTSNKDSTPQDTSTNYTNARFRSFLTTVTGTTPSKDLTTFAGYTTHPPLTIRTKYYAAKVSIWCDELPAISISNAKIEPDQEHDQGQDQVQSTLTEWTTQMLSSEAREVREVLGGIILLSSFNTANLNQDSQVQEIMGYVTAVNQLRDMIEDESGRDVATLVAVEDMTPSAAAERQEQSLTAGRESVGTAFAQKLEESCLDEHGIFGWDIVAWKAETSSSVEGNSVPNNNTNPQGSGTDKYLVQDRSSSERNEFGEKLGIARVLEVLEQVDWSISNSSRDHDDDTIDYDLLATDDFLNDSNDEFDTPTFKPKIRTSATRSKDPISEQSDEFQREIMGLRFALEEQQDQQASGSNGHEGDDIQVEKLGSLMERVMAIKEAGSEMSKADREKFARREIAKIMRDMDFGE